MLKHVHYRKLVLCCSQQRRALNGFFYHVRYQSLYCRVTSLCPQRTSIHFPSGARDLSHLQTWLWVSPGSYSVSTRVLFQGIKWSVYNTDHSPYTSLWHPQGQLWLFYLYSFMMKESDLVFLHIDSCILHIFM